MDERPTTEAPRLPYHAPTLREHGTVEELTLAGGPIGSGYDGAGYGQDSTPSMS
jgi:hypothetical protein